MKKSIFELEKRLEFPDAFNNFFSDVNNTKVSTSELGITRVGVFLERCIRYWPYRCSATSISSYLSMLGVNGSNPQNDTDYLYKLELIINLLHWAPDQNSLDDSDNEFIVQLKQNDVERESERLLVNAAYLLEQGCNMYIREISDGDNKRYVISKRDADVDATLEDVPELSELLLGYLDIRNEKDLDYKEKVLIALNNYMEPNRKKYKGMSCSAISEEFFAAMNSFGIRHNGETQVKLPTRSKAKVYDGLFKMALYILRTSEVNDYKEEMKKLREK